MPPKPKLIKADIIDFAFNGVRAHGWEGLTARYLAENLQTSTKPIYFHFKSMFDLEDAVVERAMERILAYATEPRTGDPWIDSAVGVVMFAIEEKHVTLIEAQAGFLVPGYAVAPVVRIDIPGKSVGKQYAGKFPELGLR